jgi:hypothetical protein
MDRKEELKDEVATHLELALVALYNNFPETTRQHIRLAEEARHKWDRILVDEYVPQD